MLDNALSQACCESPKDLRQIGNDESIRGNLLRSKERIEKQLKKVTDALSVLDSDPKFESNIETLLTGMRQ